MEANPCRPRVLIVDDASENIQQLTDMLHGDWLPMTASNGVQALKMANEVPAPDVILLDTTMPGMNGYEVCSRLKSERRTRDIPVIFVTTQAEKHEELKGLALGGADYITRPLNPHLVKTRIRHQLEIKRYRDLHDGLKRSNVEAGEDCPEIFVELYERKRAQEVLTHLNEALESRLAKSGADLASARAELQQESQRRAQDRLEIGVLSEQLARQTCDAAALSHELESLSFAISHDLRAPLRHLVGFSSALLEDYGDRLDEAGQSFLGCITKAAKKMETQIEALLGLSRVARHPLNLANVDLSALARESVASLQGSAPERRDVFTIAGQLVVQADATLLRAALDHLLGNAWKFTKGQEKAAIELGRQQEGNAEIFFVRDNGAGFDMKYADRLFGAFQRMHQDSEFEGAGIGLATVQRIVNRHGGRIWADATVDGGATFYFTLSK